MGRGEKGVSVHWTMGGKPQQKWETPETENKGMFEVQKRKRDNRG